MTRRGAKFKLSIDNLYLLLIIIDRLVTSLERTALQEVPRVMTA